MTQTTLPATPSEEDQERQTGPAGEAGRVGQDGERRQEREPAPRSPDLPGKRPARPRDPYFDNAKFLGVLLVVCGHVLVRLRDAPGAHATYLFIYMFHMPLFIVLAGYFSRSFTLSAGKARKLITNLAVPYVVFEVLFAFYRWAIGVTDKPTVSLLDPYFVTWFLVALFAWRLSTPVWRQLRWPLGVAVAISVLSGTTALPSALDLYRLLGFLPFFVLGLVVEPRHIELLKLRWARVGGALVLCCGLAGAFLVHHRMTTEWALWRLGFADLNVSNLTGGAMRLGMLTVGAVLTAAFLAVVPARRTWFTRYGSATMYAFLLHGFGVKLVQGRGWDEASWLHTTPGVAVAMVAAVAFGVLLMTAPVRRVTRWAVEPRIDWMFTGRGGHDRFQRGRLTTGA